MSIFLLSTVMLVRTMTLSPISRDFLDFRRSMALMMVWLRSSRKGMKKGSMPQRMRICLVTSSLSEKTYRGHLEGRRAEMSWADLPLRVKTTMPVLSSS